MKPYFLKLLFVKRICNPDYYTNADAVVTPTERYNLRWQKNYLTGQGNDEVHPPGIFDITLPSQTA